MRSISTLLAGGAAVAVAGCAGGGGPQAADPPVNNGLSRLAGGAGEPSPDIPEVDPMSADAWEEAALDLQRLLDEQAAEGDPPQRAAVTSRRSAGPPERAEPGEAAPAHAQPDAEAAESELAATDEPAEESPQVEPAEAATPQRAVAEAAAALRDALLARAVESVDPGADARRLALLEGLVFEPGAPSAALNLTLLPGEQARLVELRELARRLTEARDAAAVVEALESTGAAMRSVGAAFAVREALLATSVSGFGQFEAWGDRPFLAGQTNRVLLYTEVERFAHRRVLGGANAEEGTVEVEELRKWEVELSQEATLYHDAPGDLQVWHHPRARIRERSRNQRRDFYLVNELVLPARLSVGRYRLKVVTRDEVSGAVAERIIGVRLVADPALVRAGE